MIGYKSKLAIACVGLASLAAGSYARPFPPQDKPEAKKAAWLHENYLRDASAYEFTLDEAGRQKLELRPEPVMKWTSLGDYNGEVFVWTHQGAAAVVGCIFSGPSGASSRQIMHEFHSLAPAPLHSAKKGGSEWLADEPGIRPELIAGAPEPAATPARRLPQMRDLARRFTAQVEREDAKTEMRLLPQPIYRYEVADEKSEIIDGAVFAFVWTAGTDPELLLVIEARRGDRGVRWDYAAARFTNREAWLKYQDKEVWKADAATTGIFDGVTTKRYGAFQVRTIASQGEAR